MSVFIKLWSALDLFISTCQFYFVNFLLIIVNVDDESAAD